MKQQINSFKCAFRGLIYTIKHESHMRFHLVISAYILVFANFYEMSVERWSILLLLIASVIMAETFNTSLEELCNLDTDSYNPLARIAKDVAAGAVLIVAGIAVTIGILMFWQIDVFINIFKYFMSNISMLILLVLSLFASGIFVALGPVGFKNIFYKYKIK